MGSGPSKFILGTSRGTNTNVCITSEKYPNDIAKLLSSPMTNARGLHDIIQVCPQLKDDIIGLPRYATLGEFGCGKAVTINDLLQTDPEFNIVGIDSVPIQEHTGFSFVCGDLNMQGVWDAIPDESLDYAYSFYTSMYLKDPIFFLKNIQKKLKESGSALIHLGYNEQYKGGLSNLLHTVFKNVPINTSPWVGDPMSTELFSTFLPDGIENIYKNNLSIALDPIFIKLDKHTDLCSGYHLLAEQGFFINESGRLYKTRQSEKRYTYTIAEKQQLLPY